MTWNNEGRGTRIIISDELKVQITGKKIAKSEGLEFCLTNLLDKLR